jgi:hypothetical protein
MAYGTNAIPDYWLRDRKEITRETKPWPIPILRRKLIFYWQNPNERRGKNYFRTWNRLFLHRRLAREFGGTLRKFPSSEPIRNEKSHCASERFRQQSFATPYENPGH